MKLGPLPGRLPGALEPGLSVRQDALDPGFMAFRLARGT